MAAHTTQVGSRLVRNGFDILTCALLRAKASRKRCLGCFGIPEVQTDISGNVTMNQVLRLLYADQLSPIEDLFRFEEFDRQSLRDTVGRLLCGAYDSSLYDNELRIRALDKQLDTTSGELKSLFQVLGKTELDFTPEWIGEQRRQLEEQLQLLQKQIEEAERDLYVSSAQDELTLRSQQEVYDKVQRLQEHLASLRRERDGLVLEIVDSDAFIKSLQNKIRALQNSGIVADEIEEIRFASCPSCYAPITEAFADACHLCKTPFGTERVRTRITALINESGLQIRQSTLLQASRRERVDKLNRELQRLESEWQHASQQLASLERLPSSEATTHLRALTRKSGYLERELEDLDRKAQVVTVVEQMSNRKLALQSQIARLRTENDKLRAAQEQRLSKAYTLISDEVRTLLHNDLHRQDEFKQAERIAFSFADNKISVDGQSYFSASSRAILKASFCVGFLAAATKAAFFRHPRFCMLDILENMGVEPIRSQNFQREIIGVSRAAKVQHQIIYATTAIAPEADDEAYTVGRYYTQQQRTLNIARSSKA
jgi:hypothetical protein